MDEYDDLDEDDRLYEAELEHARRKKKRDWAIISVSCAVLFVGGMAASLRQVNQSPPNLNGIVDAMAPSDDFELYQEQFIAAAETLVIDGRCSLAKMLKTGGWERSQNHGPGIYFINWTGHVGTRWYVDVRSGRLFQ